MIVSMTTDSPCRNCTERSYSCHSTCERYRRYKDTLEGVRAKINAQNAETAFHKAVKKKVVRSYEKHKKGGK